MSDYGWKFIWNAAFFIVWSVLCSRAMERREYHAVVLYGLFALSSIAGMTVWLYLYAR